MTDNQTKAINDMTSKKYDLIIIGGGTAAFAAANIANKKKKRTLLINSEKILPLGGTCVNVGCVPSKSMLFQGNKRYEYYCNNFNYNKHDKETEFIEALKKTMSIVNTLRSNNYQNVLKKQTYVDFIDGTASFVDSATVSVGNVNFTGQYFLIATGASTLIPQIKGIDEIEFLTNANIFNLKKKPKTLIVVGGGPQGAEFAQIFNYFGVKVTLIEHADRILPKFDSLLGLELEKYLAKERITIHTNTKIKTLTKTEEGINAIIEINDKEESIKAENILFATGIKPRIEYLQLNNADITFKDDGFINVNEKLQTSQAHIYAAGDVTGLMPLETVAAKQGSIAVTNMFDTTKKTINYNEIPSAVFTFPEAASIGITDKHNSNNQKTLISRTVILNHIEKAIITQHIQGAIKMVIDSETGLIHSVHIISPLAADIIVTATYAIKNKMTIYDIRDTIHVFPTLSEMIKKVAQSFEQSLDEIACCVE